MTTFQEARTFLLKHRTDYDAAVKGFRWPEASAFNWALDWFDAELARDPDSRDRRALWIVDAGQDQGDQAHLRDAVAPLQPGRQFPARARAEARRPSPAGARQRGAAVGDHAGGHEARRGRDPRDDAADRRTNCRTASTAAGAKVVVADAGSGRQVREASRAASSSVSSSARVQRSRAGCRSSSRRKFPEAFTPDGPTNADDPLLLYFTSGTTAKPKLVRHSQRSYPVGALSTMYWLGLQPGDVHLNISSPGWAKHAWSCFFAPWNAGATVFIVNQPRFDAKALLGTIGRCGVTTFCAPPTVWRLFIQEGLADFKVSLREVCGAGEPLNPEVIDQVREAWGLTIRDGYGQTETTALVGNSPGQKVKVGSMGRPLPGYRVRDHGCRRACRQGGRDVARARRRTSGRPDAGLSARTASSRAPTAIIIAPATSEFVDDDGYFTFVGRADDVFKSSDYRISPFELESVLIEHEAVAEAAVVPSPDPIRLAIPKAYILLIAGVERSPETALSIFKHLHARLAPFKRIRKLELVTELPKTISGKIRRVQLRRLEHDNNRDDALRGREFREEEFPELQKVRTAGSEQ